VQIQVLIRTESEIPVAAQANIKALETCFWQFSGQNHFHVVGIPLPGIAFIGADSFLRRWYFDRRFDRGSFGRRAAASSTRARSPRCSSPHETLQGPQRRAARRSHRTRAASTAYL
jgi:hypothetical protein